MINQLKEYVILLYIMLPSGAHHLNKCLNMELDGWVKPPKLPLQNNNLQNTKLISPLQILLLLIAEVILSFLYKEEFPVFRILGFQQECDLRNDFQLDK